MGQAVRDYLSWAGVTRAVSNVFGALSHHGSEVTGVFSASSQSFHEGLSHVLSRSSSPEPNGRQQDSPRALRPHFSQQAQLNLSHVCFVCRCPSTALDIACSSCGTSVCLKCADELVTRDTRCPRCKMDNFTSAHAVELMRNAAHVRDT